MTYTNSLTTYGIELGGNGFIFSLVNPSGFEYVQIAIAPLSNDYTVWMPTISIYMRAKSPSNNVWQSWRQI